MEEEKKELATPNAVEETKPSTESAPNGEAGQRRHPRGDRKGPRRDKRERAPREEVKEFEERVVYINRVSKTVKGGRRMKFTALVVIGDRKGRYGFALSKAAEVPDAIKKATEAAKKNLHTIKLSKGATLSHEVIGKYGACNVYLKPAPEGTGVVAGGPVRAILELAGVQNVCSKVYGSRAPINVIRATNEGLSRLKSYKDVKALRSQEQ